MRLQNNIFALILHTLTTPEPCDIHTSRNSKDDNKTPTHPSVAQYTWDLITPTPALNQYKAQFRPNVTIVMSFSILFLLTQTQYSVLAEGKGSCQKRFIGFCPLRGYPPPYPLNGKSFCQKTLSGKGGYTPPP